MLNVLLEHFVVSPEILRLKQRMFFVLYWEACFYLKKICNVIVDCRSFYRNDISSLQKHFLRPGKKGHSYKLQKKKKNLTGLMFFWQILANTFRVKMLVIWKNFEIE